MPTNDIELLVAIGSSLLAIVCALLTRSARAEAHRAATVAASAKEALADQSRRAAELSRAIDDQTRRLAWLESRMKGGMAGARPAPVPEPVSETPAKPTMTERRHRVLALAQRGQDAETIATMLNMPRGEVELIIDLNRAA